MNFIIVLVFGILLLFINIAVIIYLLAKSRKEKQRYQACEDCYYYDADDFTPCPGCVNGSNFKDYGKGQSEDIMRDWRLYD